MKDNAMIDSIVGASVNVAIVAGLAALVVIGGQGMIGALIVIAGVLLKKGGAV